MDNIVLSETKSAGLTPSLKLEWARIPVATHLSGLTRSLLYDHIRKGDIKSVCLRKRNSVRGVRLVNVDSLNAFIASFAEEAPTQ